MKRSPEEHAAQASRCRARCFTCALRAMSLTHSLEQPRKEKKELHTYIDGILHNTYLSTETCTSPRFLASAESHRVGKAGVRRFVHTGLFFSFAFLFIAHSSLFVYRHRYAMFRGYLLAFCFFSIGFLASFFRSV
ncbi:hypothetical protein J3F83DRAFT_745527 [Trichoderma novae-zelandiae]